MEQVPSASRSVSAVAPTFFHLLRGGSAMVLLRAAQVLLSVVNAMILPRVMGPTGFGIYAFAMAVVGSLAAPALLGMPELVVRETARLKAAGCWSDLRSLWRTAHATVLLLGGGIVVCTLLVLQWRQPANAAPGSATLAVAVWLLPLTGLLFLRAAQLRGLGHVARGQFAEAIIRPSLVAMLALAAVLARPGEALAPNVAAALQLAAVAVCWMVATRLLQPLRPAPLGDMSQGALEPWRWLRPALPLAMVTAVQVGQQHAGVLVLGIMAQPQDVAVFQVVARASALVVIAMHGVNAWLMPQYAALYAGNDMAAIQRLATWSARLVVAVTLPVAAIAVFSGGALLGWFFGEAYAVGDTALAILIAAQLLGAALGSVVALLNMTGHARETLRISLAAGVSNIVLCVLLVPPLGVEGAALAAAASVVLQGLALHWRVRRRLGVDSSIFASTVRVRDGTTGTSHGR
jgi:O-antigen/teichoic acid export membrane protein